MAQKYKFFNSGLNDPRIYQAADFAEYFGSVLSTGLLHTDKVPGMAVSVEPGTLNTVVSAGKAIMKGHLYENTTPLTQSHSVPEPDLDRIDRIVLRLDLRNAERNILLHVKEGVSAAEPTPPELQRDNFIYEISLAKIRVRANTSSLQPADLIDERLNEQLCGLVYSLISIPTSQFQQQWDLYFNVKKDEIDEDSRAFLESLNEKLVQYDKEFHDWFDNLQDTGFETPAGAQAKVDAHANRKDNPHAVTAVQVGAETPDGAQAKVNAHANIIDIHRKITFGTADPTGGSDGDIYFQYE